MLRSAIFRNPNQPGYGLVQDTYHTAGGGCFLGFFASLVLRCWPFAMIVLLVLLRVHINTEKSAREVPIESGVCRHVWLFSIKVLATVSSMSLERSDSDRCCA